MTQSSHARSTMLPDRDALDFAASVRELLESACDSDALRAAWDSESGRVPGLWKRLADVGVAGLTVPEQYGGSGADLTSAVAVLLETGRAALPEPVAETIAAVAFLASSPGPLADEWLPRVAAGEAAIAIGNGPDALTMAGQWADLFLLGGDTALHAVPRDAVDVRPAASLDHGAGLAVVSWEPTGSTAVTGDDRAAFDTAVVCVSAQLVGLAQAMLDMSVRYALQREQFGKPIGSFQAVKHQLADVYVANAFALPVLHRAAWSVAHALPSRSRDVSHAKHAATVAAERAARTALQVHAGIGYTYEHDLHIWMKRTWTLSAMWGDLAFHRARVSAAVLADEPPPRVP